MRILKLPYKNSVSLTIILLSCFTSAVFGQLTGTKNIPVDYVTISAAVTALNAAGVGAGGVTFNVPANYTETITATISLTATGTVANPILFQKDPATTGANPVITAYTTGVGTPATAVQDGIWRLVGSDYVTIDGIDVTDNPANASNPSTMEYGYALYKATTSNGCQFVTIKNCVITLNNINNALGTAPMVDGSTGIIVMNALPATATSIVTPIAGGTNSNNKFYTNTIQNCNTGIALIGFATVSPFTLADATNDVGGISSGTGNTIINYGGAAAAANPAVAIRTLAQYGLNVSYNTINNNNGSGTNHPNILRGVFTNTALSANSTVTFNTITLKGGGTTQPVTGIENVAGSTAAGNTVNISNNLITNCTYSTATTGGFTGILNSATPATLTISTNTILNNSSSATVTGFFYGINNTGAAPSVTISSNTFSGNTTAALTTGLFVGIWNAAASANVTINANTLLGNSTTALSGVYYAIYNTGAVTTTLSINSNIIGNGTTGAFTFNAANSGAQIFINATLAAATAALSISNNNFQGITYAVQGTGANTYISNTAATLSQAINSNTFTSLNVNTTGSITFIANSVVVPATGTQNVNSNSIGTSFNKAGVGGTVTLFTSAATSVAGSIINNNSNNFSNITVSGATVIAGWTNTDAGSFIKKIQNNTFSNWTGGTGAITGMAINLTGTNNATAGNTISNISSAGAITGITTAAGKDSIYSNTINTLASTGASAVTGISITAGTSKFIFRNKIYDLSSSNVGGTVNGILVSGATIVAVNIYNNVIGDLRTPIASAVDPIRAISVTATAVNSSINVYYNTIYLNATSTGLNFGTTGIYHTTSATATTAVLTLRNNIVENTSTSTGTGFTVDYRRSTTALTNYAAASNNNIFYAGPAGATRLIFYDGTNSDVSLASYKTRVATRDAQSFTEDLITGSKFLSTSGSSSNYLHLDPAKATQAESGGVNIAGFTIDFDGQIRQGNTGYVGSGTAPDLGADEFAGTTLTALSGSYNVGTGQTYTSLTSAGGLFAAVNSLGLSGNVTVNVTSDLTEDGSNALFQWVESGVGNYTLTIQPNSSTARLISGDVPGGLIRFNGADRVTIDGSNATTNKYFTFRNTNTAGTTGTAFTFLNGATSNTIRYSTIESYANATNGVILFSTSTVVGGNSSNTIQNCDINATVGINTGIICIYSLGTVGNENSSNSISTNNIYNYRDRALDITATGSKAWTISGNSFYNGDATASINYASATALHGIRILGGTGYLVSNNYIGGNAASAGGTSALYSSTLGNVSFQGIVLTTSGAVPASNIKGNTIANITVSSVPTVAGSIAFAGIETSGSGINIGGALAGDGNIIGSNTVNSSIIITTTTGTATFTTTIRGISCGSTGGLVIRNQVGGIDIKNIGAAPAPSTFAGINISNATAPSQVNSNIIGSTGAGAASNSIRVLSTSTGVRTIITGIAIAATVTSAVQVDANIIQNLSHQSTATTTTVGGMIGISNASTGASTVTITNNTVTLLSVSTYTTGTFYGISNSGACATISINSNTINDNTTPSATGVYWAINNAGAVTSAININSNNIGNSTTGAFTFSAANSGVQVFINNTGGTGAAALSISNNNFQGITYTVAGSGANTYILNTAATLSQAINSNTFTALSVKTTGSITFIANSVIVSATGTQNVNSNSIVTSFNKTSVGGTVTLFTSAAASVGGSIINNNSNNFSNITVTGATIIAGWVNTDAGASTKTIQNNTFSSWTGGTSAITALSVALTGASNSSTGNAINNISSAGAITGITTAGGNDNIYSNVINTLSTTGAFAVTGIAVTGGTTKNIYKNKIYDLQASNATGSVNGILVSGATIVTINIFNNLIGDLRTPIATSANNNAIIGISVTATAVNSTVNVYYNTVYLNATSSGAIFGSSGIFHTTSATATTASLNLRNNSITNTSTPTGATGFTVAYRRSSATLTNYAATSNNSLFYAGVPAVKRLIFYDGTNSDQTVPAFITRMATRDAQSVTENLTVKFLSTSGSSSLFLHMDAAQPTIVESGAINITGYTDDFDAQIRAGNPGYTGGGTLPDIGADEVFGIEVVPPAISYTALTNTTFTTDRAVTGITITDASGINNNAGTKPRIYFKRFSDANVWLDNTSTTNGWKYTEATNATSPYTFTISYSLLYGGSAVTAGVIQYFIAAQDLSTVANVGINSGTFTASPASVALTSAAFPIGGTINSYNIPFAGTYNVGTGEVFTSLTKADGLFASINTVGLMSNVTFNITSDITEDGVNALNQWTESGAGNYTLTLQPDASTLRAISGNVVGGLIRLNGADRVTIDGTNGGSGSYLTFRNTNAAGTTGTAFTFINGAAGDVIRYCNIEAYANATNGVILFSSSAVAGGNSNILIDNCEINATVASNTGNVAIYSAGTVGNENSGNTISNNSIFNYRDRALDITATGSTGWTISNNNLYNGDVTAAINYAGASTLHGIRILGGTGYSLVNNFIGGNAAQASGTKAVYSSTLGNLFYEGIVLTTSGSTPASLIQGNTVASIAVSSVPTAANSNVFTGIEVNGSGVTTGGTIAGEGNTIGSNTANGSISVTTTTTVVTRTSNVTGIYCTSSGGSLIGNQVGSIDIKNIGTNPAPSAFIGIYVNSVTAPSQVNSNIIGSTGTGAASNSIAVLSTSTATATVLTGIGMGPLVSSAVEIHSNSVQNIANLSTTSSGSFTGINNLSVSSAAILTISNNTIKTILTSANASAGSTIYSGISSGSPSIISNNIIDNISLAATGTAAQIRGISVFGAFADTISGNNLSNFSTASTKTANIETGAPSGYNITGILNSASVADQVISGNTLSYFNATTAAVTNTAVTGIAIATAASTGDIYNNRICAFTNTATGTVTLPGISGIMAANGSFNAYNNVIKLDNSGFTNGIKIYGINHAAGNNWNYYFNSVSIGGNGTAAAARSSAFIRPIDGVLFLRNNIFINTRTGTGSNYAVSNLVSPAGLNWPSTASDYNDLFSIDTNTTGEWGVAADKTFTQWQSASGGETHSVSYPVSFISSIYDLQPDSNSNCALDNTGTPVTTPIVINTDISSNSRSPGNPDPGAYEFSYTAFTIIVGSNSPVCSGDVSLTVNPGSAISPTFSWSDPANAVISTIQNPVVTAIAGQYKVRVIDVNGCNVTDSTLVAVNQRPTATITSPTSVCDSSFINLNISVTGSGVISGTLSNGDNFSGSAPLIIVPVFITTTTSLSITNLSDDNCTAIPAGIPDIVTVIVTHKGDWLGITNNWNDPVNWCEGILPTSTDDVTIPVGTPKMPLITSSVSCNDLTINNGDTLTIAGTGTLNIAGTLSNFGTYIDNGTTNFNGTSGQQTFIGLPIFNNLTLDNSNGLILPADVVVKNNLTITSGILNANDFAIKVGGNWINNTSTTAFTAGTATVTFNGTTAQAIGGAFATTFNNLIIASTASTVTLNTSISIGGNLSVSTGTFDLAGFTANRATAGGTLIVSNNARLKIGGTNTYPTNYATNTLVVASTVEYSGTNQTVANQTYGNLALSSSSGAAIKTFPGTALAVVGNLSSALGTGTSVSFTAASNITVGGNVSIGASTTFNGGSYSHSIGGNWVNNGTFNGNTGTITFTGSGASVSGSGAQNFNNLTVAAALVTFSTGSITLTGNLATIGSGSFNQASVGTLLMTGSGTTINGSGISLDNLTISGSVSTITPLNLTGNLSVSGSLTAGTGTITMSGASKTMSGVGSMNFGSLSVTGSITTDANFLIGTSLNVSGSFSASAGTATFTGTSSLSGTANLYDITINGTALHLGTNSEMGIANTLTITSGTLDVTTSGPNTVNFNGPGAQNINSITYGHLVLSNGNTKTAVGDITTTFDITIGTGTTFDLLTYTLSIYGDWINNGTFISGISTVQFLGPATAYITGITTFNILTSNTSSSTTELIVQNDISAAIVNMTNGIILTGSNTLTITDTRTGNGFIRGNIQRTHVFITGVPYAFEGPDNTITFSAVSSVTSITVSVEEQSVSDFPFGASVNREYDIAVPAGTYNATLRLHYEDDELNGNDESSMALWNYNGSSWASSGKTANSTTSNYVEQSGLTDITNRWTLSDDGNVVEWNGSVSTDWHTTANWTIIQGAPSTPPSESDIAELGTAVFAYQPTISDSESVNSIHFGSTQAITLTLAGGGSLTSSGNIDGDWSADATHTINVNNQSLTVTGDLILSDGANGQSINLNIGSGNVRVLGSLIESGDASINFSSAGTLNIHMDFNYISGIFNAGNGTVSYNGDENQDIANLTYYNLTINKAGGLASINASVTILGNLLTASGELEIFSTTSISGDVTIDAGSILQNNDSIYVGGNWANNGTYIPVGSSILFNGSGTQTISASNFGNFNISKPSGTAILTGDLTISGNLIITSGTLDFQTYFIYRDVVGGFSSIADGATGIIGGNNGPVNFSTNTLGAASTVIFNGADPQYLVFDNIIFGNLIFRNAGTKILSSDATINGNFTIDSGASFIAGSYTIALNGNWINNGTFTPSTGTVLFTGTSKSISGVTTFNQATVFGSYTALSDATFNGLFNVTNTGSISSGATIFTTFNGDFTNSGTISALGTCTFSCNVVQHISLINAASTVVLRIFVNGSVAPVISSTSPPQFGYITINNTAGVSPTVGWTVLFDLTIGSGASFNGGATTDNILGALDNNGSITSGGTFNFNPSSAVTLNLGSNFSSTGTVIFGGSGAMTLAGTPTSFHNVTISNTNGAGITPSSDWNITNDFIVNSGSKLNAGNYTYLVGGNIANNGTISSGTSTFTLNGTVAQDIFTVSPFNNLTINNTAGLATLSSNATVNGILNFAAGIIQTGSNLIVQQSSGTVTGAAQSTGWVDGNLQKNVATGSAILRTFEVGDDINYTPVSVLLASVTASGDLTAKSTAGDHPDIANSEIDSNRTVNRYFTILNTGTAFTTASVTFNWVAADVDLLATTANFKVKSYVGSVWTLLTEASPLATSIQATDVLAFGDFAIGELKVTIWTGAINTNWFTSGNWTSGVPLELTSTTIPGSLTNYPVLDTGIGKVQSITIQSGATLTVTGASLKITGAINNSGAFTAGNGTIVMSSSTPQNIPANTFTGDTIKNLTVNNIAGVTLDDTLLLSGILNVLNGQFSTGGHLTLISTATQTAQIDGSGAGNVLGNVTMQRFLASGFGYKYLSSPFQAATVNEFSDDVNLADVFPTFYRYDESQVASGWIDYTATSGLLIPMQGYAANLGSSSSPKTIDITGVVNNDTVACSPLYNHNELFTQGFNLVGNPYPSPIDWDITEGWIRTDIDDAVYYFNASDTDQYTGTYSSYVNGISSDSVAVNIIPAMQGFFVHVTDGSFPVTAQLTLNNSARSNDLSAVFHKPASLPLLRLSAGFADESSTSDPTVFYFDYDATTTFNKNLDALKLMNTNSDVPNLYAVSEDSRKLSIEAFDYPHDNFTVLPLGLKIQRSGYITFNARNILLIPETIHIYLLDNEKGVYQDLRRRPDYRLFLEAGTYENRFSVVFSLKDLNSNSIDDEVFDVYISGADLVISTNIQTDENSALVITNMLGLEISSRQFMGNGRYEINSSLSSGMYVVSLFANKEVYSKKIIIVK